MVVLKQTKVHFNDGKLADFRTKQASARLFTDYQLGILNKILNLDELTKQDKEVYSRILKPRINAIIDFYEMALLLRHL